MTTLQPLQQPALQTLKGHPCLRLCLLASLLLVFLPCAVFAAKDKKAPDKQSTVVFLPFAVTTQPPQDYLRSGLANILATRLSSRAGVAAVQGADKTGALEDLLRKGSREEAKRVLKAMQGDFLLIGSLEQQQEGYEVLIHVFGGKRAAPAVFSRKVAALDKALPALDELAGEMADKVFSQKQPEDEEGIALPAEGGVSGFQTTHPDKAYLNALAAPETSGSAAGGAFTPLSAQSSGELAASFLAMDAGDVDGDGAAELVLLEQGRLAVYRVDGKGFRQADELRLPSHLGLHAVHLAHLDGNKGLDICISASSGDSPASQLLRWDGHFHVLDDYVPYYLRPDSDAAGKPILLGQAGDGIFRLTVSPSGKAAPAEQVEVPAGFGLYDFIRADLDQDGRREVVGLSEDNKLLILDQNGKPLWKSEESYGAGRDALGTLVSRRQAETEHPGERNRKYLHTRLIAQDVTGDGKPEIIVGRNRLASVKFFSSLRWFEGSSIAVLRWDGSMMHQLWETANVPGYTVDYQVLPSADRPAFRLFSVESDDSGSLLSLWGKEKSVIRMQELGRP